MSEQPKTDRASNAVERLKGLIKRASKSTEASGVLIADHVENMLEDNEDPGVIAAEMEEVILWASLFKQEAES